MSVTRISAALRRLVEERANRRCEYCLLPMGIAFFPHEVDHVIAEKHSGATHSDNLAFACCRCNRYKGTDLGSFDPQTGAFSFLFNPRQQKWVDHFTIRDFRFLGLTPEGHKTVKLLQLNSDERIAKRRHWLVEDQ